MQLLEFVLDEFNGLNVLFQANEFKLHRLLPEVKRVLHMLCLNFMRRSEVHSLKDINVEERTTWIPLSEMYPGTLASETIKIMLPHKKSFLSRCRDWYKEAVRQVQSRIDIDYPILAAIQNIHQLAIIEGTAALDAAASVFANLPTLCKASLQTVDRRWRSLLVGDAVRNGGWEQKSIEIFWKSISEIDTYKDFGLFMLKVTALPQSTAAVERAFSKISNNKTKLLNALSVRTVEAIVRTSDYFSTNFDFDDQNWLVCIPR